MADAGTLELVRSSAALRVEVRAELGAPESLIDLYSPVGPAPDSDVPWIVEDLFIFSLDELMEAQSGYR